MMLKNNVAVIYGPGGAVGRTFAREGAKLFLAGRHRARVEIVAKGVVAAGGAAEVAEVDALDEQAVDRHEGCHGNRTAGFTGNSASQSGDKLATMIQFVGFAGQMKHPALHDASEIGG